MGTLSCTPLIGFLITPPFISALDTYISDNETFWQSTSDFVPINSSHDGFYGHIRLWEHMIMSLDIEFHGRVTPLADAKWEQMLRLGWPSYTGGDSGALSRYPSLWLDNAANVFHFSLSHSDNSGWGKDFNQLTLIPKHTYSVYIEWNDTWLYFAVDDNVLWNKARNYPTTKYYIGRLLNIYIASDSPPNSEPYVIADVTLRNIVIQTIPPTAEPTINTINPTLNPTKAPTLNPSHSPSYHPTLNPTIYPSQLPTIYPTLKPTLNPTASPSTHPSVYPSKYPTINPTISPTIHPTVNPTLLPTNHPSYNPTHSPATMNPSYYPTFVPSANPTFTFVPTVNPTISPSNVATLIPSSHPTQNTLKSTSNPIIASTRDPTKTLLKSTLNPTANPIIVPISDPTRNPTANPVSSAATHSTQQTITTHSSSISTAARVISSTNEIVIHKLRTESPPKSVLDDVDSHDLIYLAVAGCVGCILCTFMTLVIVNSTKKAKLQPAKQHAQEMVRGSKKRDSNSPYFQSRDKTPTSQYMEQTKPVHDHESEAYEVYGLTKDEISDDEDNETTSGREDGENVSATSNVRDHETETEIGTELDYDYEDAYEYALEHETIEYEDEYNYEDEDIMEPGIDGMSPYDSNETAPEPATVEIPQPPQIIIKRKYCMSEELEEEYLKHVMNEVVVVPLAQKRSPPPPQHHLGFVGVVNEHKMVQIIDDNDSEAETLTVPTIPDACARSVASMREESITMLEAGYEWITLVLLEIDALHWRQYVDNFKHHHVTEERLRDLKIEDLKRLIPNHETRNEFHMLLMNKLGSYHE